MLWAINDSNAKQYDYCLLLMIVLERGKPDLILDTVVKNDMFRLNFNQHLTLDRAPWHKIIHVVDPTD